MPQSRTVRWLLGGIVVLVLLGAVFVDTAFGHTEVRQVNTQPETVEYDGATYHVGVVRRESALLRRRSPDEVWVSRRPDMSYGHAVAMRITGTPDLLIREAEWRTDGVSVRFESGHELFVPARSFIGGR